MDARKTLDGQAMGLMLGLCLIWGFQQVALKLAAPDMAPILQIGLRSGASGLVVLILLLVRGEPVRPQGREWQPGLLAGLLFALEYLFLGQGLLYTTASHIVVFLYTGPAFAALGLHWRSPAERLSLVQWGGLLLAFAGLTLAFLGGKGTAGAANANMLLGDTLGLFSGLAWAATTVIIRTTSLSRAPASQTLLYQLTGAFLLLLPAALVLDKADVVLSPRLLACMSFQILVVSFGSFLIWFWLLRTYLASRLGVFAFLTPFFGVLFGILVLGDPLEPTLLAGAVLVVIGIIVVSRK